MQIRRLTCFDYRKLKKLVNYLNSDDNGRLAKSILEEPAGIFNAMLPLSMKFTPESFILIEENEILGLITIITTPGNPYKINITRLIFKENMYETARQLVDFVIQKYGGKGARTFMVTIDECHDELFNLFINGCGFRQCSSETLWKIEHPTPEKSSLKWRYAQNSDGKNIAELYNSELINIYKPSLMRYEKEFKENLFCGFNDSYKIRYIVENEQNLLGYFSITTSDNINYILDMTLNNGYEFDYNDFINVMLCEIASKKHAFHAFIKQKKYTTNSDKFGEYLTQKGFIPILTKQILIKDFYQPIKENCENWKVFLLGENQVQG